VPLGVTIFTAKNIMDAYKLARKSRKTKQEVYLFDQNIEERLLKILDDLKNRKYIHSKYKEIVLVDSKKRYIFSPQFRDHIFHHLIYKQIYETLDNKMVHSSFACRKWYWSHKCVIYLKDIIRKEKRRLKKSSFYNERNINDVEKHRKLKHSVDRLYYLKIDFSKYFFSVNHYFLKEKIRKYIFDELYPNFLQIFTWMI